MRELALHMRARAVCARVVVRCSLSLPPVAGWLPKTAKALLTGLLPLSLTACFSADGSGRLASRTYDASGFSGVALGSEGVVTIMPGEFAVSASAEDDVLPTVTVERRDETLVIGRDVDLIDGIRPTLPIEVRIAMPVLDAVSVSGSGSVVVRGLGASETALRLEIVGAGTIDLAQLQVPALAIDMHGAGWLSATGVEAGEVNAKVRGSGRVSLAGVADGASIAVSGAGLFRASHLRTSNVDVDVTGAGQVAVWAQDALRVRIDGNGRVLYRGTPTIRQNIQRDGELVALGAGGDSAAVADPSAEYRQ